MLKNKQMMKRFLYYYVVGALVAVMASCSSSRHAARTPMIGGLTGTDYMEKVIEWAPKWDVLTAKATLDLRLESGENPHVSGTLRIKRGEVIQLSVAPLLGIEVARMEITPDRILVVDRLNKRYVEASFDMLSQLANTELNFNILQSLMLNELFLPDKPQLAVEDAGKFRVSSESDKALLETKSGKVFTYRFWTTAAEGLLAKTCIGVNGTNYVLDWNYDDFGSLDNKLFPQRMIVGLGEGADKKFSLDMKLSRLSTGGGWNTRTELSSKYKKIELQELLKQLLKS